jgi:MFS family permease
MSGLRSTFPTVRDRFQVLDKRRGVLAIACGAHALHDGYTDLIYVLLPVWQAEFALSYAALGALRLLCAGSMASLQVPATLLARRLGAPLVLALGTALCGCVYLTIGIAGAGFVMLAVALTIGGAGSSTQHPLASALIAREYTGTTGRAALGTYNFAGDMGKMALPAATAWLIAFMSWRHALGLIGILGLVMALVILLGLPRTAGMATDATAPALEPAAANGTGTGAKRGFPLLLAIGVLDSGTRMGFLAFLPFVLQAKGAGKLVCGLLGARLGVLRTVILTELGTAAGIMALSPLPLAAALTALPLIGIALNGTSSVLYGTVPELVPGNRREHAFGLFYTGTIGGGAIAPVLYGLVGDSLGPTHAIIVVAAFCLATLPLAWLLAPALPAGPNSPIRRSVAVEPARTETL